MSRRHVVAACLALLAVVAVPTAVAAPDDAVVVAQSLDTDSVAPGGSVDVTVTVEVTDADAPGIDVSVPANWTVTVEDDGDSAASYDDREWVWRGGDEHTVVLTLGAPETAERGAYDLVATGSGIYRDTGERVTDRTVDEVDVSGELPLTADAGEDRTVTPGDSVELDGSESVDPVGDGLTYRWTQVSGPTATLAANETATPTFEAPDVTDAATLAFELTVTDANGTTDTDRVAVTVERPNRPPTARAGGDRSVTPETDVELDATGSSDPDGDDLGYAWTQVEGPSVDLEDAETATPEFESPDVNDPQRLVFEVAVTDGERTSTDTVVVTAAETPPPVATVGENQSVTEGDTVTLDGRASEAAGNASYAWTQVEGPSVDLDDASGPAPSFDVPSVNGQTTMVFRLTVTDRLGREATDSTTVMVRPRSGGGDSGGGGGGGGGGGPVASEPSGPIVAIDRPDGRSAIVNVVAPSADGPVGVTPDVADGVLTYDRLSLAPSATPAILRVAGPTNTTRDVTGVRPVGTLATDTAANATVTTTFSVAGVHLSDVDPDAVTAYRVDDGSVTALNTTFVDTAGGRHVYNVTTAAPFELTVGVPVPALSVTDVRSNVSETTVGDPVEITVTVTNEGRRAGTETVSLAGAGTPTNRTVSVPAGDTATTTFVRRFDSAGAHTVRVGEANTTVSAVAASTPSDGGSGPPSSGTATDAESATTERTTGLAGPGFGVALTLVAVLVAALLARRR